MKTASALPFVLAVAACDPKPRPVDIDAVLADGRANAVAAQREYDTTTELEVEGTPIAIGTFTNEVVVATAWQFHAEAHVERHPYAYAVLESANGGHLLCYFPDNEEDAAMLRKGVVTKLRGRFQEFWGNPNGDRFTVVLTNCELPKD